MALFNTLTNILKKYEDQSSTEHCKNNPTEVSSPPSPPVFIHPWMALTLFPQLCKKPFGVVYLLWPRNSFQSHCFTRQTAPFSRFHSCFSVCYLTFGETERNTFWLKGIHLPSKVAPAVIFLFSMPSVLTSSARLAEVIFFFYSLPCSCCKCFQKLLLRSSLNLRDTSRERLAPQAESEFCFSLIQVIYLQMPPSTSPKSFLLSTQLNKGRKNNVSRGKEV